MTPMEVYSQVAAFLAAQDTAAEPHEESDRRRHSAKLELPVMALPMLCTGTEDDDGTTLNRLEPFNTRNGIPADRRPEVTGLDFCDTFAQACIECHWSASTGAMLNPLKPGMSIGTNTGSPLAKPICVYLATEIYGDADTQGFTDFARADSSRFGIFARGTLDGSGFLYNGYALAYDRDTDVATALRLDAGVESTLATLTAVMATYGEVTSLTIRTTGTSITFKLDTAGSGPVNVLAAYTGAAYPTGRSGFRMIDPDAVTPMFCVYHS